MSRRTPHHLFVVGWLALCVLRTNAPAEDLPPPYPDHTDLTYYLDAHGTRHPVRTPEDWAIRRAHILAHMQSVMGPLPRPETPAPLQMKVVETEQIGTLTRKKITYHTDSPDHTVAAYLLLPPLKEGEKRPAVLCLHQTIVFGKMEPVGLGGRETLRYGLELARRGYVTLSPDYPSFGDSAGYDFAKDQYVSGTMKAIYDNVRAVDLLQSLPEVDPERIACIGHSLGGHNTMFTAAFEPRIKALVSSCGFTRFHKYYAGNLKGWTGPTYMPLIASQYGSDPDRVPFDFPEIVAAFAPRPFFACAPLHDNNFEVSGVRDAIAAARPIYDLLDAPDNLQAVYPDSPHDFPDDSRRQAYEFLDRHLKHAPLP